MSALPTGTVTFLFTDVEGSTKLWETQPAAMQSALARHDALLRDAITDAGGTVFKTVGDAFCAAFSSVPDALAAALASQVALSQEAWPQEAPIRVRIALHTGIAQERNNDYFGPVLNRVARLLAAGHGGQTLLSGVTGAMAQGHLPLGVTLSDLGIRRLKDLTRPEQIFQLVHPDLPNSFPALETLDATPNNLPQHTTDFIGREKEMRIARALLTKTRLLTLVGAGGTGKTRMCLQLAADALDEYPDGAWLVELASLSDPEVMPQSVAQVLGIKEQAGQNMQQTLGDNLKEKRLLLVLDNCEHLLDACAALASNLLRACPNVHMLLSSREGLGVSGEHIYQVPSLTLPDPKKRESVDSLLQFESVRLFMERAHSVQSSFTLTDANVATVARVCSRLDGIPLAVELAAARVRMMSVEQIEIRLNDRFRLLSGGSRIAEPRQQTLRSLIDWSYKLLSVKERMLFHRLATFAGGCTLEACEAVGAGGNIETVEVMDLITALIDKSLLVYQDGSMPRYRFLESIREYAHERLNESEDGPQCQIQHRDFFLAWSQTQATRSTMEEIAAVYEEVDADYENVRRALEWSETHGDAEAVLHIANALTRYWYDRGLLTEGRRWLRTALPQSKVEDEIRAWTLNSAGIFAMTQGDLTEAQIVYEESLRLYLVQNKPDRIAASYNNLGLLAHAREDFDSMERYHEQSLAIYRSLGDTGGMVAALSNLGLVALETRAYSKAQERFEETLELMPSTGGTVHRATLMQNLGVASARLGNFPVARACLNACITMHLAAGVHNTISTANALIELGRLMVHEERYEAAVRMAGAAQAILDRLGAQLPVFHKREFEEMLSELKTKIDQPAYETLWEEGLALSLEDISLT